MLADSVDPDQIALEHSDQGLHCLPVILLNVNNTLVQKRKVNVQVFPSIKGNLKTTLSRCLLSEKCMLFFMYQVDSGHLHFTSKKIPVCGTDYHKSSEYWGRQDQTAPNYEQSDQGLHCFAIPPASFAGICIHCSKKER